MLMQCLKHGLFSKDSLASDAFRTIIRCYVPCLEGQKDQHATRSQRTFELGRAPHDSHVLGVGLMLINLLTRPNRPCLLAVYAAPRRE